jgi:hypothetical protein
LGVVRLDGHEIVRDDSHVVSINGEFLDSLSTGIDQPESVLLSWSKFECWDAGVVGFAWRGVIGSLLGAVEVTFALNKIAVGFNKLCLSVLLLP